MSKLTDFLRPRWRTFIAASVAAPLFFMWLGWLVPAIELPVVRADALLSYKAQQCVERVRANTDITAEMLDDFTKRREFAAAHTMMPGDEKVDSKVMNECSSLLAG